MSFRSFREKVNLFLYDGKDTVLNILKITNIFVTLSAIATIIILFGYKHTPENREILLQIIRGSFVFYIMSFFVRLLFNFSPKKFLKQNWVEGVLAIFLIIEGISYAGFNTLIIERFFYSIGIKEFDNISAVLIQIYFFIVLLVELSRGSFGKIPKINLHPSAIFMLSFTIIILAGTGLLMLPEMTSTAGSLNFLDSLFMSTSATCVTGLATVDMATEFTFKGQMVILILIKLGGLNIIAFGSFIALASKFGIKVRQHEMLEDFVNKDSVLSSKGMLGKVIRWSIAIEIIGAFLLYIFWKSDLPEVANNGDKIFSSIFHSVSAFNNAGLSLFEGGLGNAGLSDNYFVHLTITVLVFFGALGFLSIFELFDIQNLRERMRKPWKKINFSTKLSLYFSLAFVVIGLVLFYLIEKDNTLEGMSFGPAMIHSLFQSVTRTSGFNTVDIGALAVPSLLLLCFLMFVGSSSSSTGGGIKTSTFGVLWASVWSTVKGRKHIQLFKRTISSELVKKALTVLLFFITGNLICIFLLSITEHEILAQEGKNIMDLIFEEVSAFGTVGLSTGITADLTPAGKIIIIVSMFVGRVGTLTFAYLLGREAISKKYKYPDGHTMIG